MAVMASDSGQPMDQFRQMAPTIPLSRLVEWSVQRTYHDLQVLADL